MATIDYKQLATPEANLIELLAAQNQDGTYTAKLMGSEPFAVLAAKTIYNAYNDIEDNMAADVEGPASSTDNALARFDGTTGKLLQNSNAILTDAGALSLASNLTVSGTGTTGGNLRVRNALGYATGIHTGTTSDSTQQLLLSSNAAYNHAYISKGSTTLGIGFSSDNGSFVADDSITITAATKLVTLTGNLTVSGTGTSSFAGVVQVSNTLAAKETNASLTLQPGPGTGGINYAFGQGTGDHVWYGGTTERMRLTYLGNVGIGTTSPLGVLDVRSTTPDVLFNGKDTADPVLYFGRYQYDNVSKSGAAIKYVHGSAGGSQEYGRLAFLTATGSFGALTERMRINESGNLLVGTTVDSSALLQVGTNTTTAAGGMKFGTDTSWYRSSGGVLSLDTSAGFQGFEARRNGTVNLNFYSNSSDAFIGYKGTGSLTIQTLTGSTALTLDSSQNATFAGKVGIGVSPASWELNLQQSAVNSAVRIISPTALGLNDSSIYISWASGSKALIAASYESTGSYRPLVLSAGGVDSLTLDTSGNATFAGQVNILNSNSYLKADSSNLVYETYAGKGHQFKTGGTTALTLDSSQNATFAGKVTTTQVTTASGTTASTATGTAVTLFTLSGTQGLFIVHAYLGVDDASNYAAFATVVMDGTAARIVSNNATLMSITLSGSSVQATQGSGTSQTIKWKYTRM